jgi:anti-sigma regulatory factor (Ser/Thr protein kinase)
MSRDDPSLIVTLPPRARHLALVRRIVGGYACHLGMADQTVEDLKTVVSEACAIAVDDERSAPAESVRVEARRDGPDLAVAVRERGEALGKIESRAGTASSNGDGGGDDDLRVRLIARLSRFEVCRVPEGGTEISMRLPLG